MRYRCRYGCSHVPTTARGLRKHMMRVHCLFSAAHKQLEKCSCGRTFDRSIKELVCTQLKCKDLTDTGRQLINVQPPRDAQEEADTFAYDHSGPEGKGPRRMVIVEDGDEIMSITQGGQVVRSPINADFRPMGRSTQGVRIFDIAGGEKVVSVERIDQGEGEGENGAEKPGDGELGASTE